MNDLIWNEERHAPLDEPLVVANQDVWAFARKIEAPAVTLQRKWPFVVMDTREFWVVSGTYKRVRLDFAPTHWAYFRCNPPPVIPSS